MVLITAGPFWCALNCTNPKQLYQIENAKKTEITFFAEGKRFVRVGDNAPACPGKHLFEKKYLSIMKRYTYLSLKEKDLQCEKFIDPF